MEEEENRAAAASRARVVGSRSSAIVGSIQPVGLLVGEGEGKGGHRGSGADSWPEGLQAERTLKQHNQASSSSTYSFKDERVVMGTRVVERLRESGIEVSKENERLVCDHFRSLPKRYGIAVKDALSEILMHISLLEDSRQRNGQIAHCLRAVVANLPTKDPSRDVTGGYNDASPRSPTDNRDPPVYIPIEKTHFSPHRIVSATPVKESFLGDPGSCSPKHGSLDSNSSTNHGFALQDCYELTVAMPCAPASLGTVYTTIGATGLNVAETHGFTTNDGYYLYWFVLEDNGRVTSEHLTALDNLLHARFSLDLRGTPGGEHAHAAPSGRAGGGDQPRSRGAGEGGGPRRTEGGAGGSDGEGQAGAQPAGKGMRRGSSFLNLWKAKLDIQQASVAEWEVDPNDLILSEKVGQGAFGAIHKGTLNGEVCAIKMVKSDFQKEFEYIKEFAQEISIISGLTHDRIVRFMGACTKGERVCIMYSFCEGGNLKHFLQKTPKLTRERRLQMAADIAEGMEFVASKNIVHRDLKAANILLDGDGNIKIGDFGVARLLPRGDGEMTAETGTYRWMAPEVIEHRAYNTSADVYSFGVLMWEIFTGGKSPYELLSPIQAAIGVAKHGLRPKIPSNVPKDIARIMESCWEASPEARPSWDKLRMLLQAAIEGESGGEASAAAQVAKGNSPKGSFTGLLSRILK